MRGNTAACALGYLCVESMEVDGSPFSYILSKRWRAPKTSSGVIDLEMGGGEKKKKRKKKEKKKGTRIGGNLLLKI